MQSFKGFFRIYFNQEKKLHLTVSMRKGKKSNSESKASVSAKEAGAETNGPVYSSSKNEIILKIHAKPGAKESAITGIDNEAVGVQIGSPPMDGEANKELIRYLAEVLNLRKSDLLLAKGSRSKEKTLIITKDISVADILSALNAACK